MSFIPPKLESRTYTRIHMYSVRTPLELNGMYKIAEGMQYYEGKKINIGVRGTRAKHMFYKTVCSSIALITVQILVWHLFICSPNQHLTRQL